MEPFIYEMHDVLMSERFDYCSYKTTHKVTERHMLNILNSFYKCLRVLLAAVYTL